MDMSNLKKLKKMFGLYKKQKKKEKDESEKMFKDHLAKNNKIILDSLKEQLKVHRNEIELMLKR